MFELISGILILIVACVIGVYILSVRHKAGGYGVILLGLILSTVIIAYSCTSTIPTGYTGILTTFGEVENTTLEAGLRWKAPWQSVIKMDNRVQKDTIALSAFSSDIQEVSIKYTVNYQIDKANAMNIYKTVGTEYYNTVVAPAITESVKTVTARYTAEELVGRRDTLAAAIEQLLSDNLIIYNIKIVSTSVEDLDFTDVFTDAVEAKQVAQQNKLKAQTEAEQRVIEANAAAEVQKVNAAAEAEVKKINADAEAYETRIKAEAEAEANAKINASLTKDLIAYIKANGWDGKLPTYVGGEGGAAILNFAD